MCNLEFSKNTPSLFFCLVPHFSCPFLVTLKGGYGRWGRDRYGPPIRTDYRLIVENLSSRCSWQDLKVCICCCSFITRQAFLSVKEVMSRLISVMLFIIRLVHVQLKTNIHYTGTVKPVLQDTYVHPQFTGINFCSLLLPFSSLIYNSLQHVFPFL